MRVIALAKERGWQGGILSPLALRKTLFLPQWVFAFYVFLLLGVIGGLFSPYSRGYKGVKPPYGSHSSFPKSVIGNPSFCFFFAQVAS